jgi:hypothetical protein
MKIWLYAALVVLSAGTVFAQEAATDVRLSATDVEKPSGPERIAGDTLTSHTIAAFFAVLKKIREVPSTSADEPIPAMAEHQIITTNGELECSGDEEPFADVFKTKPIDQLNAIAQEQGFQDAKHWQRVGGKILAKSAIEAMAAQAKLSDEEMKIVVGDAFDVE